MSVCKFFQTNSCRFGSRCRNRHVYEQHDVYDTRIKPSGVSILQRNKYVINQDTKGSDLSHHFQEINKEINASESIWPASCYCYLNSHGNLQGFEDVSPDELRFKAYEADASNNPQKYIADVNNMKTNVAELRKSFMNKAPAAQKILSDYLSNGPSRVKELSQPTAPGFDSSVFFSSGKENTSYNGSFPILSQNTSSFSLNNHPAFRGQQQSSAYNANIFANALHNGNDFPSYSSSQCMPNSFRQTWQQPFRQQTSVFGEPIQENAAIRQNIFSSAVQGKPSNEATITAAQASQSSSKFSFSNSNADSLSISNTSGKSLIYSQEAELTPGELEQFKSTTFSYGKTPLKCPPRELC